MTNKRVRFSIEITERTKNILVNLGYMDRRGKCKPGMAVGKLFNNILCDEFDNDDLEINHLKHLMRVGQAEIDRLYQRINAYNKMICEIKSNKSKAGLINEIEAEIKISA